MPSSHWLEQWSVSETLKLATDLASSHARQGGVEGLKIDCLIRDRDFLSLCDYELDYATLSVSEARQCRQALAFFSKASFLTLPGVDREEVAIEKFMASEDACRITNGIFRDRRLGLLNFKPEVDVAIRRAQQKIVRVLGRLPHISELKLRFGPGATTLTKKKNASVVEKLQAGLSCSASLRPHAQRVLDEVPHMADLYPRRPCSFTPEGETAGFPIGLVGYVVQGDNIVRVDPGVVECVPKNAKTHRVIVKEPPLNTMLQLALGDYMTERLLRFGIDIKDQERNKSLACLGSLTGGLGTLDLTSASDMISTEIVWELLPFEWAFMLASARSETVVVRGKEVLLEKFSSMGNGFTFPLETLIFWALSSSVEGDGFASVYGDDIIVKTEVVPAVMQILEVFGFLVNSKKSYWTGSFRESCGGDYLSGIDIRPFYLRELVSGVELFKLHNFYWRNEMRSEANAVKRLIHPSLRIYGPDGFGDGHLLCDPSSLRMRKHPKDGYGGVLFDTFQLIGRRDKRQRRKGDRVLPVYAIYTRSCVGVINDDLLSGWLNSYSNERAAKLWGLLRRTSWLPLPGVTLLRASYLEFPSLEIPERESPVDGIPYKEPSLPGSDGYRRVSIYTLSRG